MPRVKIKVTKKNIKGSTSRKKKAVIKIQRATRRRIINQKKKKSDEKKKKALDKINKATRKLKRKQEPCPICLEKIDKKERIETKCGHFFHKKCIQNWCLEKAKENKKCLCPVCKKKIPEIQHRAEKQLEKMKNEGKYDSDNDVESQLINFIDDTMATFNREREEIRTRMETRQRQHEESVREIEREIEELERQQEERRIRRQERRRRRELTRVTEE